MAIKNAQYKVKDTSGYDVFHFESNAKMVKVLNNDKSELGNLNEYLFTGKTVTSGAVTDIKVNGLYKLTNVTGLPSGVNTSKPVLLKVESFGSNVGVPEFIRYEVIDSLGNSFQMSSYGSTRSAWTNGGVRLQSSIDNLTSGIGSVSQLNTSHKSSAVGAINEVNSKVNKAQVDLSSLANSFNKHNHDGVYLKVNGETTMNGNVNLASGAGLNARTGNGANVNVIKSLSSGSVIEVGNANSALNMRGSGELQYNGQRVVTIGGNAEGLNAELLGGVKAENYARKDKDNTFTSGNVFRGGLTTGKIEALSGNLNITASGLNVSITGDSLKTNRFKAQATSSQPAVFSFAAANGDEMTLSRLHTNGNLVMNNNKIGKKIFEVQNADNIMRFEREIMIGGKKLYLQDSTPAGTNHPVGSIWIGG